MWYLKLFDKLILVNSTEMERFKFVKNKSVIIPIGIPKFFFEKNYKKVQRRKNIILYVGRIHKSKGVRFLLDYVLESRIKAVRILLVGPIEDKEYYFELKGLAEKNKIDVKFLGKIERRKLVKIYDNSDLVFLPSPYEAFGIVILEAFARGKPVIAVDSDGPRYLVKNSENGFLVRYGDVENAAKYIKLLLKDKKLYKKISMNNIKKAKQFRWDKIAKKVVRVYKEVLRKQTH